MKRQRHEWRPLIQQSEKVEMKGSKRELEGCQKERKGKKILKNSEIQRGMLDAKDGPGERERRQAWRDFLIL